MSDDQGAYNPQVDLERVAKAEDKGQALSELSRDDMAMVAFGQWYSEDPVGFSTTLARLGQEKPRLSTTVLNSFQRAVEAQALGMGRKAAGMSPVVLKSLLPHAAGDELMVPAGYTLDSSGTYQIDKRRGRTLICHYPLILEGYVRDYESGASLVVVAWRAGGEWRRMAITREAMGVSSDLARVAGQFGAPIHSANASYVVSYFSAFEALNLNKFEECKGVTRMGWTPEMDAFLVGETLILGDSVEIIQSPATLQDGWAKYGKVFIPTGQEVQGILRGYHKRGTIEQWKEALDIAKPHPFVLAGVYLSLLPPLMQIVGADNLVFEWSGRSSIGKTTALTLAASVWGQPKMNLDPSIVSSWRITDVYLERLLATLGDLPFFLDDTRTAQPNKKNGLEPIQAVYDVVAGTTKGRGTVTGTEAKRAWRTVLMSTGESPITGESKKGGVFARTWAVGAWPWGETTPNTAAKVLRMESLIGENYGHLGPFWVQRLMRSRPVWPKWKEIYRELRDSYGTKGVAGDSGGITGRLGKNLAAVELAANIARTVLPELFADVDFRPMVEHLWRWAQVEGCGNDLFQEAAVGLRNHIAANQHCFWPRGREAPALTGWMGVWPLPDKKHLFPSVYVRPEIVVAYLKQLELNPMEVIAEWDKRRIILPDIRRSKTGSASIWARKPIQCDGARLWVFEFVPPVENSDAITGYDELTESVLEQEE